LQLVAVSKAASAGRFRLLQFAAAQEGGPRFEGSNPSRPTYLKILQIYLKILQIGIFL
jgi:hypothetical protein